MKAKDISITNVVLFLICLICLFSGLDSEYFLFELKSGKIGFFLEK